MTEDLKSGFHRRGVKLIEMSEHAGAHLCRAEKAEVRNKELEAALKLALEYLGRLEPGDSRAVSDEFVAMLAALSDLPDLTSSLQIIHSALLDAEPSCYCGGIGEGVHAGGCPEAAS